MTNEQKQDRRVKRGLRRYAREGRIAEPLKYYHTPGSASHVYSAFGDYVGELFVERGEFYPVGRGYQKEPIRL